MKWDMGPEAQGVDRITVHVLPNVDTVPAPAFRVESLVERRYHFFNPLMKLFDLGVLALIFDKIVLPPIEVEHNLHQKVVDLHLTLIEELKQACYDVDVALVFQGHHWVGVVVGANDLQQLILIRVDQLLRLLGLQDRISHVAFIVRYLQIKLRVRLIRHIEEHLLLHRRFFF